MKMPETKKFKKLKKATIKQYGKKEGTRIAHAIAQKHGWKH
jgi:hypothetical protein